MPENENPNKLTLEQEMFIKARNYGEIALAIRLDGILQKKQDLSYLFERFYREMKEMEKWHELQTALKNRKASEKIIGA